MDLTYRLCMDDASMVGLLGRVTGTVGPGLVGEVIVRIRGGAEHFLAYPASPRSGSRPEPS